MTPKLSIIIPVYNTESYLPQCLDSILSQSFTDFELLLIDDGSTDNSGAICDNYAQKDTRIKVFHLINGGVSSARNFGLDKALGEWIYFVDSDDELFPEGLRTMVECISDEVDSVMGGFEQYEANGKLWETSNVRTTELLTKRDSLLVLYPEHSIHCYYYLGYMCLRMFRNKLIQVYSLRFDTTISIKEDTLFITQYLCKSNGKTRFTTTPVYKYKMRKSSAMSAMSEAYDPKYISSFDAVIKMHSAIHQLPELDKQLSNAAKYSIVQRIELIYEHMLNYNAVDKKILSELKRKAIKEVGLTYYAEYQCHKNKQKITEYIDYQYHRNKRRVKNYLKKLLRK